MNRMTRNLIPAVCAGLVLLVSGSAAYLYGTIEPIPEIKDTFFAISRTAEASPDTESSLPETEPLPDSLPDTAYLVKLEEDTLRVYAEGAREPCGVYELPADWLPDYDRILLEYGFRVSDETELRELLEDYIS